MNAEDEKPSFELLKQMVSMPEVCELLGFEINSQNKITSPWNPTERTPSCHVYEDHVHDFSTGKGGDVIDLVQAVQPELEASRVLWLLWSRALKAGKQPGDVEQQKPRVLDATRLTAMWSGTRGGRLEEWEDHLGVKLGATLAKAVDGVLWIPHGCHILGVYGIKYRSMGGRKWSEPGSQFTHKLYHPRGWYAREDDDRPEMNSAIICEGESDCWAMDYKLGHKADVFALPSGASCWKDHWAEDLKSYETIWICPDNDRAGKDARDKIHRKMHWDRTKDLMVPSLYGDAREAIRAGWIPRLS